MYPTTTPLPSLITSDQEKVLEHWEPSALAQSCPSPSTSEELINVTHSLRETPAFSIQTHRKPRPNSFVQERVSKYSKVGD